MERIAERTHANGWTAIVESDLDGDLLIASAFSPKGERHYNTGNAFDGGVDDHADRLTDAQKAADRFVLMASGHGNCDCPPWTGGDDVTKAS